MQEISIPASKFCHDPKTALQNSLFGGKKKHREEKHMSAERGRAMGKEEVCKGTERLLYPPVGVESAKSELRG